MTKNKVYGIVTYYPSDEEFDQSREHVTTAYSKADDPEGSFEYRFGNMNEWKQPIHTAKDMEFFKSAKNKDGQAKYHVTPLGNRPFRPRPTRESMLADSVANVDKDMAYEVPAVRPTRETVQEAAEPVKEAPVGKKKINA